MVLVGHLGGRAGVRKANIAIQYRSVFVWGMHHLPAYHESGGIMPLGGFQSTFARFRLFRLVSEIQVGIRSRECDFWNQRRRVGRKALAFYFSGALFVKVTGPLGCK